eukprot:6179308-Pleurochrysis_carterae.AAC.1
MLSALWIVVCLTTGYARRPFLSDLISHFVDHLAHTLLVSIHGLLGMRGRQLLGQLIELNALALAWHNAAEVQDSTSGAVTSCWPGAMMTASQTGPSRATFIFVLLARDFEPDVAFTSS